MSPILYMYRTQPKSVSKFQVITNIIMLIVPEILQSSGLFFHALNDKIKHLIQ